MSKTIILVSGILLAVVILSGCCCYTSDSVTNSVTDSGLTEDDIEEGRTREYISKSYYDLWAVIGPDSEYTSLQKDTIFNTEYSNKYVNWTGTVEDADTSVMDSLVLEVRHRAHDSMWDYSSHDVEVYLNRDQYDKLVKKKEGDTVTYSGKVDSYDYGFMSDIVVVLYDGEIIS